MHGNNEIIAKSRLMLRHVENYIGRRKAADNLSTVYYNIENSCINISIFGRKIDVNLIHCHSEIYCRKLMIWYWISIT